MNGCAYRNSVRPTRLRRTGLLNGHRSTTIVSAWLFRGRPKRFQPVEVFVNDNNTLRIRFAQPSMTFQVCRVVIAFVLSSEVLLAEVVLQRGDNSATATADASAQGQDLYERSRVGTLSDGRIVVPTNQVLSPAGRQVIVDGRPTDVALAPNGRWLAVLNVSQVMLVDVESGKTVSLRRTGEALRELFSRPTASASDASSTRGNIGVFDVSDEGQLAAIAPIVLPTKTSGGRSGGALPVGLAVDPEGKSLFVAININNTLGEIDIPSGKLVREIAVGNAPYDVVLVGRQAYVSNWAGRLPAPGDVTGPSGEPRQCAVDPVRNIANDGSVSVVDLDAGREIGQIVVGLHPSGIVATRDGRFILVANANSDTLSVIDGDKQAVVETISTRPAEKLLFGSAPNALAISPDGRRLYASNGTNNSIAVIEFQPPQ